jgi:uncharacterized DUF497 family protein
MITPILDLYLQIVYTMSPEIQFEWDEDKRRANIAKHGIDFFELRPAFWDPYGVYYESDHQNHGEPRFILLARCGSKILHIVFTDRGRVRRIISARPAHRLERFLYDQGRDHESS